MEIFLGCYRKHGSRRAFLGCYGVTEHMGVFILLKPEKHNLLPFTGVQSPNFKLLWSPGIDSKESIPLAYVALWAGTTTLFLLDSYPL
jgi:hypothetical protein